MRIGFLTERMLRGFGVDLVIDQLAQGLAARGHQVTVYASVSDGSYAADTYRVKLIPTATSSFFPRYDVAAQRHLSFLNSEGPDAWLVHTFPFFALLPRLKAPSIAVEYGVSSTAGFPAKIRANFAYVKFMQERVYLRGARRIVTISEYLKRQLPPGLAGKASVIYLGADHYQRQSAGAGGEALRKQLGVGEKDILMLYIGRLSSADQPYKGTAELAELGRVLAGEDKRLRLLMVGFGGQREQNWLEKTGAQVITNAPAEQMPAIYTACDIYVTASHWEGFDLPLVEAQSFGKPVVALDIGAHPEVMADGESGLLAADLDGLGQALRRLASNDDLRTRMGEAARGVAERFKWKTTVTAYEQLIKEVVDG